MELLIEKYCHLKNKQFSVNGELVYQNTDAKDNHEFLAALYREAKVSYPKFFKMDNLARTGFLASELLLKDTCVYGDIPKTNTAIFVGNGSASLDTDQTFQETIGKEYFPSPSVFVYTLPNIVMGEIAIRHKIFGENTFFVSECFNSQLVFDYVYQNFCETETENAIVGWVEYYQQQCEAFLMLVKKQNGDSRLRFDNETIVKLYNS